MSGSGKKYKIGKFKFQIKLETDAILPPFKGSTFRGVFGTALKKVVCALKSQTCETCLLRDRCVYTLVFEIPPDREPEGAPSPPHPFIIEPPLTTKAHFAARSSLDFHLLLFGRANEYLPYFVYAVEQMGRTGIGQRINGHRAVFHLAGVFAGGQVVYEPEDRKLLAVCGFSPQVITETLFGLHQLGRLTEEYLKGPLDPATLMTTLSRFPKTCGTASAAPRSKIWTSFPSAGGPTPATGSDWIRKKSKLFSNSLWSAQA